MNKYMKVAYDEAMINVNENTRHGGPFGAVVVKNGKIIGKARNEVGFTKDPTMHAEIIAIRNACKYENSRSLEGCEIYTTCYPCPMCLGAIHWAGIQSVYCGCTADNSSVKFDDRKIYKIMATESSKHQLVILSDNDIINIEYIDTDECIMLIDEWNGTDK